VEGGAREAVPVDAGEGPARAAVAGAEQIGVGGVVAEGREEDLGVEGRAVVVDLPLDAAQFPSVAKGVRRIRDFG
jgi:hypothetical protein